MKLYTLINVWSYNGDPWGTCIGIYPTEEQAQEAMKKYIAGVEGDWIENCRAESDDDFKIQVLPRAYRIISLVDSDYDTLIIEEKEMEMPSDTAQENK